MSYTRRDELAWLERVRPGLAASEQVTERLNRLPIRTRLDIYRQANEGGDLLALLAAAEEVGQA